MARLILTIAALAAVALAGCGNSRTPPPNVSAPQAPGGMDTHAFASYGFSVATPHAWQLLTPGGPLLLEARSGLATIAVWRYPRTDPHLPRSHAGLGRALRTLLAAVRARDPTFSLVHGRVAPVGHRGGLEIVGLETVDGQRRQVRSTHIFVRGAEVVIDEYAPPALFPSVDRQTFLPVVYSLRAGRVG